VDCRYVIARSGSKLYIISENGNVLERQKGTLTSPSPVVQRAQAVPSPNQQTIEGDQNALANRRVYTVPDLKNLVGRQLNGAWLRGDFIVAQTSGSRVVLQSYADTNRFGLGISQNGRPVVFAGKTLINVTLNHQNGAMIRGHTVNFTEASPLRLISVAKDAQGYTVVEAEF
jgi:hypothetical protein